MTPTVTLPVDIGDPSQALPVVAKILPAPAPDEDGATQLVPSQTIRVKLAVDLTAPSNEQGVTVVSTESGRNELPDITPANEFEPIKIVIILISNFIITYTIRW